MRKRALILAALLAVVGLCVLLWPVFTGRRLQADADEAAQAFLEERKPEQQYPELLAALQAYNQRIYAEKQSDLTSLEACEEPAIPLNFLLCVVIMVLTSKPLIKIFVFVALCISDT